ncbi:hypothetical protein LU699_10825 [Luteimonas fraxinea]|uniref:Uncharacterized protein n=1 Tax=Luteimonas fraxinea TaxID=2901869 RepID=A0ABS8UFH0_9GAMM|nr:hypothetical protein [Luteimonas fraxinea]MCD9098256.1 hypothetical protein [Luteimonas fraxinea]MCD9126988.1 hypothetical protein [Luteimonas fraxinea]UHH08806.1 hypothetical protein LU699_10825 [Luteimonas fraxinea]
MADRPVFVPSKKMGRLVEELNIAFLWSPGLAPVQKRKNVAALHEAAGRKGLVNLLEVSTKSDEKLGQRLSAFNLKVELGDGLSVPLECAFQGSKVFEGGGPYVDIFDKEAREAKRDPRLIDSGALVGFRFLDLDFPLAPKTMFYDWLYIRSLFPHRDFLSGRLSAYSGFTDIEFNPARSINCQARSCATYVALERLGLLEESVKSAEDFLRILKPDSIEQPHSDLDRQGSIF